MQFGRYINLYLDFLPFALVPPLFTSSLASLKLIDDERIKPSHKIADVMGIFSVGAFAGLFYPISMPIFAVRYLYRNRIM